MVIKEEIDTKIVNLKDQITYLKDIADYQAESYVSGNFELTNHSLIIKQVMYFNDVVDTLQAYSDLVSMIITTFKNIDKKISTKFKGGYNE